MNQYVVAALALFGQSALNHILRGYARVVRTGNPQNLFSLLAGMAAQE